MSYSVYKLLPFPDDETKLSFNVPIWLIRQGSTEQEWDKEAGGGMVCRDSKQSLPIRMLSDASTRKLT